VSTIRLRTLKRFFLPSVETIGGISVEQMVSNEPDILQSFVGYREYTFRHTDVSMKRSRVLKTCTLDTFMKIQTC